MTTEARELELCGKVEMRIALATDEKLQSILETYLTPLLLKLASESNSVRSKVISICRHIKVRIHGNQNITLPIASLLKQYKENTNNSMIQSYDLIFIQQGIGKLKPKEQIDLLPIIITGLSSDYGSTTCATLFNLFLRLLPQLQIPLRGSEEDSTLRERLGLNDNVTDRRFIATWLGKLILLVISRSEIIGSSCPGLTIDEFGFLTLNGMPEAWDPNTDGGLNLTHTKIIALNFISSGVFTDEERFLPALFASGDTNSRISEIGEDLLKRSTISLEDSSIIENLLNIYFTLKTALQTRLLILLSKSALSTTFTSQVIRIAQEAINPSDNTVLPVQGLETIKFRNALLNYMNWVSRMSSKEDSSRIAPHLVALLMSYIEDQGWPKSDQKSADILSLRALAYETLGSLAKTSPPTIFKNKLFIVRWLFRSLAEENSSNDIFVSIEGALSSLQSAFVIADDDTLTNELRSLLLEYMTLEKNSSIIRSTRFASVRWANQCLDYSDILGRWIDILAMGADHNERGEVIEEGKKGLDPYLHQILKVSSASSAFLLPEWEEMVQVFFTSKSILKNSVAANYLKTGMSIDSVSVFGNFSGSRIKSFAPAVLYCRQILLLTALQKGASPFIIDADWERKLDILFHSDKCSFNIIKSYVASVDRSALQVYLSAAFEGMLYGKGNGLQDCGQCFVDVLRVAPQEIVGNFSERAFELLPSIKSNNPETRLCAARAYGILSPHPNRAKTVVENEIHTLLQEIAFWKSAVGADLNRISGSILALGFVLSKVAYYHRRDILGNSIIKKCGLYLLEMLAKVENKTVKEAVLNAVGKISAAGVLTSSHLEESGFGSPGIIEILTASAKKGDENSILTLGRLSLIFEENDLSFTDRFQSPLSTIMISLIELVDIKQIEIQFTIGEAMTCLAACWESNIFFRELDIETTFIGRPKRKQIVESLLHQLLINCKNPKPSLKKASGIWLFSLIQNCAHLDEIKTRLRECQMAFMGLLSSRDENVQETASRGLSLVYEQGDRSLKENLIRDLVSSFTGPKTQLKVHEETELFEPGALPTGEGKSVTSYKDIISLANEVGDQSLVYKFMSLASNAATWSTRAAFGRFGLSNILSESEIDPKIYPKLYRYRFDPNPNVRRSMNDIWKAIVKDSTTTINLHFQPILTDLLRSMLDKEWRTRQASCTALADLIQGQESEKYDKYLQEIWKVSFKVLDDIKGSVREAAQSLIIVLTNILVCQVETGTSSKHTRLILKEVLPFLLSEQGMESSAQDVRAFATVTVMRLIKQGGQILLPFVPELVEKLLGLLSTIEPEEVNYVYQRAAEHRDQIDQIRSSAVSQSPLMEAVERCLDILDEPTMKLFVPNLENSIINMLGMPSKIGCASVLISLATRRSFLFRPYADSFLKILEKAVLDQNNTVSASFAKASGYVSGLASNDALSKLSYYCKEIYFKSDSENRRQISAEIIYAVAKHASERFRFMMSDFLPFIFFATHDTYHEVGQKFRNSWEEHAGGPRTVILYSKEIIELCIESLESPNWVIKHTAAFTIAKVIESFASDLDEGVARIIWPSLEKALALKVFDGKEKVLQGLVKFVGSAEKLWRKDDEIAHQMKKIIIREAKRNNLKYRIHSFEALGDFSEKRCDLDMFDEVFNIVMPFYEKFLGASHEKGGVGEAHGQFEETTDVSTLTASIPSIFKAVNLKLAGIDIAMQLRELLRIVRPFTISSKVPIATKIVVYERIKIMFNALIEQRSEIGENKWNLAWEFLITLELERNFGSEHMRLKRAETCEVIVQAMVTGVFGTKQADWSITNKEKIRKLIEQGKVNEVSISVQNTLDRGLRRLE